MTAPTKKTDLFDDYGRTPLVNDELELSIRRGVRSVLRHHNIVDGVVEADLTALIKTGIQRAVAQKG